MNLNLVKSNGVQVTWQPQEPAAIRAQLTASQQARCTEPMG